jgi:hypothetical protein
MTLHGFESFSDQVPDDGQPPTALDIAGQAVRDFNHRSFGAMDPHKPGWRRVVDAYRCLGELTYLVGGLPQAFRQISTALELELRRSRIRIDPSTRYADDPGAAVDAARVALRQAITAAHTVYRGVADAQTAINAAAYNAPDLIKRRDRSDPQ